MVFFALGLSPNVCFPILDMLIFFAILLLLHALSTFYSTSFSSLLIPLCLSPTESYQVHRMSVEDFHSEYTIQDSRLDYLAYFHFYDLFEFYELGHHFLSRHPQRFDEQKQMHLHQFLLSHIPLVLSIRKEILVFRNSKSASFLCRKRQYDRSLLQISIFHFRIAYFYYPLILLNQDILYHNDCRVVKWPRHHQTPRRPSVRTRLRRSSRPLRWTSSMPRVP